MSDTLVIVPAFNEEKNIGQALKCLFVQGIPADVLVVNDGSQDGTATVAESYGVTVLSHPCNLGYGAALQTGYQYALRHGYHYVVHYDADGQHRAEDVAILIQELRKSGADLAIGSRFAGNAGFKIGALKSFAVGWFRFLLFLMTRNHISDPTSGLRGLSELLIRYYAVSESFPSDFPDADFVADVLLHHWFVVEVPIGNRPRLMGQSMHTGWKPLVYMCKVSLSMVSVLLNHWVRKRVTV